MALSYPHRQTIIIGVVCLVAIAAVAFYTQQKNTDTTSALDVQSPTQESDQIDTALTSTSTSWKKDFFTVSTSTNKVAASSISNKNSTSTLTDEVAKDFFTRYMILRKAGQTGDQESVKNAMDQTITNATETAPKPKTYSDSDIKVTTDVSATTVHAYVNAVAAIMFTDISRLDPTAIAMNALDNQNMDELQTIDPIISGYQKTITELLALTVPQDLSSSHIGIVNGLSILLYVSQGLRHIQEDSMQAMVALDLYSTGQDVLKSALTDIRDYVSVKKISIASTEPGYLFFKINQ